MVIQVLLMGAVAGAAYWFLKGKPKAPPLPDPVRKPGTGPLKLEEPKAVKRPEDLAMLHQCAVQAMNRNQPEEAMRLMGRIFLEAGLEDVRFIGNMLGQGWLNGLWVDQAQKNELKGIVDDAINAAAREDFEQAFQLMLHATNTLENAGDPPMPSVLLMAGLRAAANAKQADPFTALVAQASEAMLVPERKAEAKALFEQALALVPNPPRTPQDQARRERLAMAIQLTGGGIPAASVDDLLAEADRLLERDPEGALGCYAQAAMQAPDDPGGWVGAAGLLRALNRPADAIPNYERAVALAPHVANLWFEQADCLEAVGRLEEALASYDRALAVEPQMANAWVDRAHVLNRLKRHPEALESLKRGLAIHPDHAVGWFNRAEQELGLGLLAEAAHAYGQFLSLVVPGERAPQQLRARGQQAFILHRQGRFEEALQAFEQLEVLDAHQRWMRASCLLALGQPQRALEALEGLPDEVSDVWIERGLCLERLKRVPEALEALGHAFTMSGRRWVHEARLRPEQAADFYGRAVECFLAEQRTTGLDRLRSVELAFARKKLGELAPEHLAELEAFDAERRATRA